MTRPCRNPSCSRPLGANERALCRRCVWTLPLAEVLRLRAEPAPTEQPKRIPVHGETYLRKAGRN